MHISKRLKAIAAVALATVALQGQGSQTLPKGFSMVPIRPGSVFLITGGSIPTNSFALIGKTGVVLVDSKTNKQDADGILKSVASVTSLPITHAILTHSDCDHANGIAGFPASIKVIATKNNLIELEQTLRFGTVESQGVGNAMPDPNRLPTMLINQEKTDTHIDGIHMVLYYWGPATHEREIWSSTLPEEKLVIAGDYLMKPTPGPNGLPTATTTWLVVEVRKERLPARAGSRARTICLPWTPKPTLAATATKPGPRPKSVS